MSWKNLSYTKKGGLIGLIIGAFLSLLIYAFHILNNFLIKLAFPILYLIQLFTQCSGEGCIIIVLFIAPALLIEGFIIGALIGWIVERIKNK